MSETLTAHNALLKRQIAIQIQYPCNHTKRRNRRPVGGLSQKRHCLKRERERERAWWQQCLAEHSSCSVSAVFCGRREMQDPVTAIPLISSTSPSAVPYGCCARIRTWWEGGTPLPLCLCDLTINSLRPVNFRCSLQYRNEVYISWHSQFIKLSEITVWITSWSILWSHSI